MPSVLVSSLLTALLTAALAPALPGDRPPPVEGVAIVEGTESPVVDVVIRFEGTRPPGEPVTTDDRGRCRWIPSEKPEVRDGDRGPGFWVRLKDSRWRSEVVASAPGGSDPAVAPVPYAQNGAQPAETRWRVRDGRPSLEVRCPPTGELEVVVRGPDGTLLVGHGTPESTPSARRRRWRLRPTWWITARTGSRGPLPHPVVLRAPAAPHRVPGRRVRHDGVLRGARRPGGPGRDPVLCRFGRIEGRSIRASTAPETSTVIGQGDARDRTPMRSRRRRSVRDRRCDARPADGPAVPVGQDRAHRPGRGDGRSGRGGPGRPARAGGRSGGGPGRGPRASRHAPGRGRLGRGDRPRRGRPAPGRVRRRRVWIQYGGTFCPRRAAAAHDHGTPPAWPWIEGQIHDPASGR